MKKAILLLCLISVVNTSCSDFLNKEPLVTLSPESFWKTESDLELALNVLYKNMDRAYSIDNQSSDSFGNSSNAVSSGTYTSPNTDDIWKDGYKYIRVTNDFLENYEKAPLSDEILNRYAGEAKFFRAYFYLNLVVRYGDVPLVTKTLDLTSPELFEARAPKADVWALIIADLEFAATHLPLRSKLIPDERINKGTAQALLARATLYAGTHYKYHNLGDGTPYLEIAKQAALDVINSGEFGIYPDYRNLFLAPGENSEENILSYGYSEELGTINARTRMTVIDMDFEPTKYMADNFLCKDGLPIGKSAYSVEYLPAGKEFENRDPRMALTIWKPGDPYSGKPFVPNLSNQTRTGYIFKKYGSEDAFTYAPIAVYIDDMMIRYAEVLLIYAEATYELSGSISDEELDMTINKLRQRFDGDPNQLPALTNAFVAMHDLDMLDMIRIERRSEMAGESLRYDDIIRWKIADTELNRPILGAMFDTDAYPNLVPGKDIFLDEDGFILVQNGASRTFDPISYLFPLPLRELSLNPQLTDNW